MLSGGTIDNNGNLIAEVAGHSIWPVQWLGVVLVNGRGGTITDRSGLLQVNSVTNEGTLTVAPNASVDLVAPSPGGLAPGVVTNSGTVENGGTISTQGGTWSQVGGAVAGNPVIMQDGTTLMDRAGAGKFVANSGNANLVGTVPKGQTVTVVGTGLGLAGKTVVNNGAIVLESQGPKTTGASAAIGNGTIRNNGNVIAEVVGHSTWAVNWQIGLTNNQAGRVTVTGGTLNEAGNGSDTNAGTVTVGPGAVWLLQEGSAFTNQRGGKIVPEISGPTSVGQFAVQSPCCNGAGVVNAGGALVARPGGWLHTPGQQGLPGGRPGRRQVRRHIRHRRGTVQRRLYARDHYPCFRGRGLQVNQAEIKQGVATLRRMLASDEAILAARRRSGPIGVWLGRQLFIRCRSRWPRSSRIVPSSAPFRSARVLGWGQCIDVGSLLVAKPDGEVPDHSDWITPHRPGIACRGATLSTL